MDSAIESRTSVGIIGLATAAWAGLGWMANLREALSQMWGLQRQEPAGFVRTKLSDLLAIVGLFAAIVVTVALTALGSSGLMKQVVEWLGLQDLPGMSIVLRVASIVISLLISWLLFTWMIARLPRESISFRSAARAGLMVAVAFEIFKQVASIYLQVGGDRSGGCDVRSRARPDGVRLHHRAADSLRDRVGGHVQGESRRRAGGSTRRRPDHPARAGP